MSAALGSASCRRRLCVFLSFVLFQLPREQPEKKNKGTKRHKAPLLCLDKDPPAYHQQYKYRRRKKRREEGWTEKLVLINTVLCQEGGKEKPKLYAPFRWGENLSPGRFKERKKLPLLCGLSAFTTSSSCSADHLLLMINNSQRSSATERDRDREGPHPLTYCWTLVMNPETKNNERGE